MPKIAESTRIFSILQTFDTYQQNIFHDIAKFKLPFMEAWKSEVHKLPFHFNILDQVRVDENAHSRLLVRLLQFRGEGDYPILKSFLHLLGDKFSDLEIIKPVITAEKNRIDARIRDINFSLLVENKVNGAADQERQVLRYIELERIKFNENCIFVLYLTRSGGNPSENSFPLEIRKKFQDEGRYKEISFRHDVLPWLQNITLDINNFELNTELLKSGIYQYLDYIEGMFCLRKGQQEMNNKLTELIKKELAFSNNNSGNLCAIQDYLDYTQQISEILENMKTLEINKRLSEIYHSLKSITDNIIIGIQSEGTFGQAESYINFTIEGWNKKYELTIGFTALHSGFFIGIRDKTKHDRDTNENDKIKDAFRQIFGVNDDPDECVFFCQWISENRENIIKVLQGDCILDKFKTILNTIKTDSRISTWLQ